MSKKSTALSFLLGGILLLVVGAPFAFWQLSHKTDLTVLIWEEGSSLRKRVHPLEWLFLYRKGEVVRGPGFSETTPELVLFSRESPSSSIPDGIKKADVMKRVAMESAYSFWDGSFADEAASPALRRRIEQYLQVEYTGWTLKYEPRKGPAIAFISPEGEKIILQKGIHFNGFAPSVHWEGRDVPVKTFLPVYSPGENTRAEVSVDLHLSDRGRQLLEQNGIPSEVPLILENRSALGQSVFCVLNFSLMERNTGTHRAMGRLYYKSKVAMYNNSLSELYWRIFLPWLDQFSKTVQQEQKQEKSPPEPVQFKTDKSGFTLLDSRGNVRPFYLQGVNLGPALPGRWFTQFPEDEHLYYRWFGQMKDLNLNTLRIYTLLPPSFYRAFERFNTHHPDNPLYLIQEIWPEEHPVGENYLDPDYSETYAREIRLTIDALHGNRIIEPRTGRAWGEYTADVSPWLLAYLVGRELEPDEVLSTNALNPGYTYNGTYLSAPEGPATEAWLASACDLTVSYERESYNSSRPIGIVSWPILDKLDHPVEWTDPALEGRPPANDKAVVDIERILVENSSFGGLFGAYHIYPNYPDFMNNQSSYASYRDRDGTFRYGGYLKEFMAAHTVYPAIVAEYGISTSAATAHMNPDGYHHGGLTEEMQGRGIIRMDQAARREGLSGSLIFEWIDEWAKKTWTTEPFMIPYDRQALWHNALDPEQNYGIMRMEGTSEKGGLSYPDGPGNPLLNTWGSESHLYIQMPVSLLREDSQKILIGLDTYNPSAGIRSFPGVPELTSPTGMESLVEIDLKEEAARVLNSSSYSISRRAFRSGDGEDQEFIPLTYLVNRGYFTPGGRDIPPVYTSWSVLHTGLLDQVYNSFYGDEKYITLRIPWTLLNVSDPSSGTVLDDPRTLRNIPERDGILTTESDGIRIYAVILNSENIPEQTVPENLSAPGEPPIYRWEHWDVPRYEQREKDSIRMLREYFGRFGPDGIGE